MANYECVASNGVEPSDSYMVKLHVLYPPHVEAVHEKVHATKGSDVRLQCKARAWPRPNFVWEFNKHVITNYPEKYHMVNNLNFSKCSKEFTFIFAKCKIPENANVHITKLHAFSACFAEVWKMHFCSSIKNTANANT